MLMGLKQAVQSFGAATKTNSAYVDASCVCKTLLFLSTLHLQIKHKSDVQYLYCSRRSALLSSGSWSPSCSMIGKIVPVHKRNSISFFSHSSGNHPFFFKLTKRDSLGSSSSSSYTWGTFIPQLKNRVPTKMQLITCFLTVIWYIFKIARVERGIFSCCTKLFKKSWKEKKEWRRAVSRVELTI